MVTPTGWKEVRLGDLGPLSKGVGIRKNEVTPYGIPCVRYGQIYTDYNFVIGEIQTFVSPQVASNSRRLRKGEILFAGSGETKEDIGKCIAYVKDVGAVAGGDIVVLTPEGADSRFLGYSLNSPNVAKQKMSRAQGDAVVHISAANLASIVLDLPPLKEQEAIAEALSDTDAAIESLDSLIAKKRDVKQATMQQLLTGRTRLPGFNADWKEVRLGEIALVVMGQSPQSIYYNTREDGIPLIQGNADIIDRKSIRRIWTSVSPKVAEPGDVLITVRAPVGYAAIASEQVCLGRGVCAIQPHAADSRFVFHSLVYWEPKWKKLEQGSTFTAANSKEVNEFTIHVPPSTKEQEAIAEALTVIDDELEALTEQVSKMRMVKEGMMQDLLTGKVRLV